MFDPFGENGRRECLASVLLPGGRAVSHHVFSETHFSPVARGVELESLPEDFTSLSTCVSQRLELLSGFGWGIPKWCKKALWNHSREPTGKR